ncbi:unnamed protein product [marine sediment metagenome]|uniref:Uncharacterized protein n=1 Tax=marine sediment metagenome TaxID=412755 RepID=X0W6K5_9ZZZZ
MYNLGTNQMFKGFYMFGFSMASFSLFLLILLERKDYVGDIYDELL